MRSLITLKKALFCVCFDVHPLAIGFCFPVFSYKENILFVLGVTLDRNQTVLQRFKPNSRANLINEQFNHLNQLQLMDLTSRHRGDKRRDCFGHSLYIILLSLRYLLTVNQYLASFKKLVH